MAMGQWVPKQFGGNEARRVRNIRHHSNDTLKKLLKEKAISEDDERGGLDDVQKLTNTYIAKIDELAKNKEHEIMSV